MKIFSFPSFSMGYLVAFVSTVLFNTLCKVLPPPANPDEEVEDVFPEFDVPASSPPADPNSFLLVGISMNGVTD
jgi:hypothetical protein